MFESPVISGVVFILSMTEMLYADRLMPNQGGYCKIQHLAYEFHDLIFPNIFPPFGTQIGYKQRSIFCCTLKGG